MRTIGLALALAAGVAQAQYPTKPVRVVVGYAAGSSTDIVGRVMADRLGAYWKQNVYVETRAGAAGNLAADAVAHAAGDGYTLLFAQNGLAISAAALPNLPYRAETDLAPLAPVASTPHILIVALDFPAKSVQQLIARARAEPGRLAFASSGVGNSDHLCGELFNLMAGGTPSKTGVAIQLSGGHAGPDGIEVDDEDGLVVCHLGVGIWRFDANMLPTHLVHAGKPHRLMTNIAFRGKTLFITDSLNGEILTAEMPVAGKKMFSQR